SALNLYGNTAMHNTIVNFSTYPVMNWSGGSLNKNVIVSQGGNYLFDRWSTSGADRNLFFGVGAINLPPINDSRALILDPGFLNPAADLYSADFHLASSSPFCSRPQSNPPDPNDYYFRGAYPCNVGSASGPDTTAPSTPRNVYAAMSDYVSGV